MRISDWSSDVCSSDLMNVFLPACSRTRERGITADPFSESPIGAPCASANAMAVAACSLGLNGQRLYGIVAYPGRASVAAFPRSERLGVAMTLGAGRAGPPAASGTVGGVQRRG